MEFSKKYALIPENELSRHVPSNKQLSEFDKGMQKILSSDLQDFEKVKLYYELLKRKTNLQDFNQPWKIQAEKIDENLKEDSKKDKNFIKSEQENLDIQNNEAILNILPTGLRRSGERLLQYLKTDPDVLKWNKRGEIVYKKNIVMKSNLADLMSLILTQRKNFKYITGKEEFLQALDELNVPKGASPR